MPVVQLQIWKQFNFALYNVRVYNIWWPEKKLWMYKVSLRLQQVYVTKKMKTNIIQFLQKQSELIV